jgi:CO dehydrogenase/acetyl-CoA synthase delta subunit
MPKKAKWGGYVQVTLPAEILDSVNQALEKREPPAVGSEATVRDILDAGYNLRVSLYRGAVQASAIGPEEGEEGVQYGVSAFGPSLEWACYLVHVKLFVVCDGKLGTANGDEAPVTFG